MTGTVFPRAWAIYRRRFPLIAALTLTVWLPLELALSYFNYFVFAPENFWGPFRLSQIAECFGGIIATAAIIFVGRAAFQGEPVSYLPALGAGLSSWWRLFFTRLISGLAVGVGFLLLILPGIYLLVRLSVLDQVVVCEKRFGAAALNRSFLLTAGRFWPIFWVALSLLALWMAAFALLCGPGLMFPAVDHWLLDAGSSMALDLLAAFETVLFLCVYEFLLGGNEPATPSDEPAPPISA